MSDDETSVVKWSVRLWEAGLLGSCVIGGGALLSGMAHYTATAKALAEEGIPANARRKALPVAAQALGIGTVACIALGAAATAAWWTIAGTASIKPSTNLSTMSDALSLANQQRVRDVLTQITNDSMSQL